MQDIFPEHESIEAFVDFCMDDDRESFDHEDLRALNISLQLSVSLIKADLESYGLSLAPRPKPRHIRTYSANNHDRWNGNPCGGGSGWDSIVGMVLQ